MTDHEILMRSQREARGVLDAAAEGASRILADANKDASQLLAKQRELAAKLLSTESDDAGASLHVAEDEAAEMDSAGAQKHMAQHEAQAADLKAGQARFAEALAEAERELAALVADEVMSEACAFLWVGIARPQPSCSKRECWWKRALKHLVWGVKKAPFLTRRRAFAISRRVALARACRWQNSDTSRRCPSA